MTDKISAAFVPSSFLWFGNVEKTPANQEIAQFRQCLGQETPLLIYDAHCGVRASALMALSGTVSRGGLMLLLCPPLQDWPSVKDPIEKERCSYGFESEGGVSGFVTWLRNHIEQCGDISLLTPNKTTLAKLEVPANIDKPDVVCATEDQVKAVELIVKNLSQRASCPLVLTADRGRGKSSALGIAAAQLMEQGALTIAVTAPRPGATSQVFFHANRLLQDPEATSTLVQTKQSNLVFVAPDALLNGEVRPDVILIDEAAAIPQAMLVELLALEKPCVFSTTVHGYEGSGRGFELRFKTHLASQYPDYASIHLQQPIRWFDGDPLERFWFSVMLMTPALAPQPENASKQHSNSLVEGFQVLSKSQLIHHPNILYPLFRLLVDAHYQTTQDDLVRMLDSADNEVAVLVVNHQIVAVALIATEGTQRLSDVAQGISEGKRRVNGHLSAQYLAYHFYQPDWVTCRYLRIVRIAVEPSLQRNGYGSQLIKALRHYAEQAQYDYLTTSFGVTPSLLMFWRQVGFSSLKLGNKRDASSGEFSLLMAQSLATDEDALIPHCQASLSAQIAFIQRSADCTKLCEILQMLSEECRHLSALRESDKSLLEQSAHGTRPVDNAPALVAWYLLSVRDETDLAERYPLLYAYFVQQQPIQNLKLRYSLTGKRDVLAKVKAQLAAFLTESDWYKYTVGRI